MKKLIAMYLGILLIREVAKYYKINSFEDVLKLVLPPLEDILPQHKTPDAKTKSKEFVGV
ncbi:MAG: hypothetical protein ACXVNM_02825 [Bacteroidia bacterium]